MGWTKDVAPEAQLPEPPESTPTASPVVPSPVRVNTGEPLSPGSEQRVVWMSPLTIPPAP